MDWERQGIKEAAETARNVVVLTGAGVSAGSGIPTFRGAGGYWGTMRAEDLASPEGYRKNPETVWRWYIERRKAVMEAEPNAGHRVLAELETIFPSFTLVTQNIDGLHRRAGSKNVLELHGSLFFVRCNQCGRKWEDDSLEYHDNLHRCPHCKAEYAVRPDVVWFGEALPMDIFERATEAASEADIFVTVGTSAEVYPAAQLPLVALRNYAFMMEFNLEPTNLTRYANFFGRGKSEETLPAFLEFVRAVRHQV